MPGSGGGGATPTAMGGAGPGPYLPCEIAAVLAARCQHCHGAPPRFGAPRALVTWADTQALATDGKTKMVDRMKALVSSGVMPPASAPGGMLTPAEKSALLAWIDAGAPSAPQACASGGTGAPAAPPTSPSDLPCKPKYEFRAYGAASTDPFAVPVADDTIQCFVYQVPFKADEQAIAWAPIIDDERVVHHWILYAHGTTRPTGCRDPNRTFLMGWAPGGTNYVMPADVGLELPDPGTWVAIEVHYNNKAKYTDARDRSGVALCTSEVARPHAAATMTFGSPRIAIPPGATEHTVTGECPSNLTALLPAPLHLLSLWPHMHTNAYRFRGELVSGGVTRTLVDVPNYSFHDQRSYPVDPQTTMIRPGDTVRTHCTYRNPGTNIVRFGEGTEDEMCFDFVLAYPAPPPSLRRCVR